MLVFKTLIHKGAMPIALYAVRSFAQVAPAGALLEIHSDGSIEAPDWTLLESEAEPLVIRRVEPEERQAILVERFAGLPLSAKLLERGGYMAKMGVLASAEAPFFYFDSDIVWLRSFDTASLPPELTAFSTETWTWYHGMRRPSRWCRERIPRRVNSGFAWMPQPFPLERFENMLSEGLYDPNHSHATDQEILAYLYPGCLTFSLDDFFRSRVGVRYDLVAAKAVAVHFPGGMWKAHLDQLESLCARQEQPRSIRCEPGVPVDWKEIARMRALLAIEKNYFLQRVGNRFRAFVRSRPGSFRL